MGIFKRKVRDHPKVENRTVGSSYAFYLGGSSAGKMVNERSAMQMFHQSLKKKAEVSQKT